MSEQQEAVTRPLTMATFLRAVDQHGANARDALIGAGFHPKVVLTKAEKAARRGYTDYGVVPDRPWLTAEGQAYLVSENASSPEDSA